MEIRTGVDIIEVNRIKESIEQIGQVFVDRIFTEKEQEYCDLRAVQRRRRHINAVHRRRIGGLSGCRASPA